MRRPPRRGPNKLSLILLVVFLGLLGGAGFTAFRTLRFMSSVSTAPLGDNIRSIVTTAPAASAPASGAGQPIPGRVNVLLLGYGGVGHEGAYLTDSLMVLSLDQQTKRAAMISVPRDIWVKVPYMGEQGSFFKLNTAYAIGVDDEAFPNKKPEYRGAAGGGNLAAAVVGGILGMRIDYWVAVDFHAFRSAVDALGGVDVDVEKAFTDYYYPRNDDPAIDPSWMTVHFNAGIQHMNGERAIQYARSRHSLEDGTDFGRSRRQQRLLLAIKDKALSPQGITKLFGLMDALSKDFKTNMNVGQIRALAEVAKGVDAANIERVSIDNTNYLVDAVTYDGQDVLVPQAKSWAPLRSYLAGVLMDPAIKTENATIQLWNASGLNGAAGTATSMLHDLGLQTLPPENMAAGLVQQNEIHDYSQGRSPSTVNYLASLFSAKVIPDTPTPTDHADIKIVLGRSFQQSTSPVDAFDPGVRMPGSAPVTVQPAIAAKPAASASPAASAAASGVPAASARASASAVASASPRVSASASAKPAASVRVTTAPPSITAAPKTAATPIAR
jgi:LCP family protein required for cell wall assembly